MNRFMHRYMDQVVQLATHSIPVRKVLLLAFNMLVPPTALFQPRVLFRVLLNVLKQATGLRRPQSVPPAIAGGSMQMMRT